MSARPPYSPRLQQATRYRRRAVPVPPRLRLDSNEGEEPPLSFGTSSELDPELLHRYPDTGPLEALLAERHGVEPDRVIVTAGADEAIDRLCRAWLDPGRNAVGHEPSFEMVPRYVALAGGEYRTVPWTEGDFPVDSLLGLRDEDTTLLFAVSPNNPTGLCMDRKTRERLIAGSRGSLLVLDQAYAEFDPEMEDRDLPGDPHVVVLRTLSKAYSLAGLRIGYAIADPEVIQVLRRAGGPFSVARPSLALAARWLREGGEWSARLIRDIGNNRDTLAELLRSHDFQVGPSRANFVLARGPRADFLGQGLAALGIAVRSFPGRPYLEDSLRITCPANPEAMELLTRSIRTVLAPEALLFDMDGVLADVSGSYRQAIRATAESFGVALSAEDVQARKAQGDANNDWIVTHDLLRARGVDASLEEVTRRFEELYQGTPGRPGLHENESPLLDRETLTGLAARTPLAVVTGRPRQDAERFLRLHGLEDLFAAMVCMEDAPAKPDPAPVRLACEQLEIEHAWLLGDTRDDLDAARGAEVLPIGVVPPGENPDESLRTLTDAGAGAVLPHPSLLLELLS